MLYVNNEDAPHYKYDDVVDIAVKSGIGSKRAYIYLAGLGVKGVKGRVMSDTGLDYSPAVKVAVKDNKLVTKVSTCDKCKSLIISVKQ